MSTHLRSWFRPGLLWIAAATVALGGFGGRAIALSEGEIALFTDTYFNCPNGGKGLYTTVDVPDLSAWGFNNAASGYKQKGGWKLYDGLSYGGTVLVTTGTGATSDCDLHDTGDGDQTSSLKEYD